VLKGMIQISTARFPKGGRGCDLDPLARIALWRAGADFGHGTGHGVGSYLSVHEGPQRISRLSTQELLPGMILSNEPGYYRPGLRHPHREPDLCPRAENGRGRRHADAGFETLTFCPIDRSLVIAELLTHDELHWFNDYHVRTREKLMPLIHDTTSRRGWRMRRCRWNTEKFLDLEPGKRGRPGVWVAGSHPDCVAPGHDDEPGGDQHPVCETRRPTSSARKRQLDVPATGEEGGGHQCRQHGRRDGVQAPPPCAAECVSSW
jgi:hypothetical protein